MSSWWKRARAGILNALSLVDCTLAWHRFVGVMAQMWDWCVANCVGLRQSRLSSPSLQPVRGVQIALLPWVRPPSVGCRQQVMLLCKVSSERGPHSSCRACRQYRTVPRRLWQRAVLVAWHGPWTTTQRRRAPICSTRLPPVVTRGKRSRAAVTIPAMLTTAKRRRRTATMAWLQGEARDQRYRSLMRHNSRRPRNYHPQPKGHWMQSPAKERQQRRTNDRRRHPQSQRAIQRMEAAASPAAQTTKKMKPNAKHTFDAKGDPNAPILRRFGLRDLASRAEPYV